MRIGIVADTHSRPLPAQLIADFKKVDFIIHAGDICDLSDYQTLAKIREVKAVYGNMDTPAVGKKFPRRLIIECGLFHIGVTHGMGPRDGVLAFVQQEFKKDKVDAVIFGHSHRATNETINGVLYFNPGSPNDPMLDYNSYGILELTDKGIKAQLIKVKNK